MNSILPDTSTNSSFSKVLPGLQLAIDSTSLGEYKTCPRKYFYSIVEGWRPRAESVHLTFGILLHEARQRYEQAKVQGQDHNEAMRGTLLAALRSTWNGSLGRPWITDHKLKNRLTLIRTIVWFLDEKGSEDPLETVILASGQPAVELSFRFEAKLQASTGESFLLCGHLDRIATLHGDPYIVDIKTTGTTLSTSFFLDFSPSNQMSLYALAGQVAFGIPVRGIIIDACQVAVTFSRFERGLVPRDHSQLNEWLSETHEWLGMMNDSALANSWPMNDRACGMYGGCPFRPVCSRPPSARRAWLQADYHQRLWDPLQVRGEI